MKEAFNLADHKGSGYITADELPNALRSVGKRLTEASATRLKSQAEAELQGKISFEDFLVFVERAGKVEKRDDDIKKAFEVFDNGQGRGLVNIQALKHALMTIGDKLSKDEVEVLLSDVGLTDDADVIDYEKFLKLIQSNV
jgi:Ca2+-binding EF-hand superfamily protein